MKLGTKDAGRDLKMPTFCDAEAAAIPENGELSSLRLSTYGDASSDFVKCVDGVLPLDGEVLALLTIESFVEIQVISSEY